MFIVTRIGAKMMHEQGDDVHCTLQLASRTICILSFLFHFVMLNDDFILFCFYGL